MVCIIWIIGVSLVIIIIIVDVRDVAKKVKFLKISVYFTYSTDRLRYRHQEHQCLLNHRLHLRHRHLNRIENKTFGRCHYLGTLPLNESSKLIINFNIFNLSWAVVPSSGVFAYWNIAVITITIYKKKDNPGEKIIFTKKNSFQFARYWT